jgi:hypothetical protein
MGLETRIIADVIAVHAIAPATPNPVRLVPAQNFDMRVRLFAPAPGVYIGHQAIMRTTDGFQLPAGAVLDFDVPAGSELFALSAGGTIQVSRFVSPILATIGAQATNALRELVCTMRPAAAPQRRSVSRPASGLEEEYYIPTGPLIGRK